MSAQFKSSSLDSLHASLGQWDRAQWLERGKRHAPQVVAGLAIIGLAWQAAELTWLLWGLRTPAQSVGTVTPVAPPSPIAANNVNPQNIANAHVFGVPGASAGAADLPQTQVNLVLAGTMALADPEAGFAIVGDSAANAKFYRVGATINGVAKLHSVYPDRVVIERNGALETLALPHGPSMVANLSPRPVVANPAADNLRRLASASPEALGNLLRGQPVFVNGAMKGYRVYPGRDRQQFMRIGLQPGDLVTAINGTTLDDPNRGNEILNSLTSSSTATVTLERNGAVQQVSLDMAQLSIPEPNPSPTITPQNRGSFQYQPESAAPSGPPPGNRNSNVGNGGTPDTSSIQ